MPPDFKSKVWVQSRRNPARPYRIGKRQALAFPKYGGITRQIMRNFMILQGNAVAADAGLADQADGDWTDRTVWRTALFAAVWYQTSGRLEDRTAGTGSLADCKKRRFEPSHALAMALRADDVTQTLELEEPEHFLRGETVFCGQQKGYTLATIHGCSIGWGKATQGILKNHYPKGLRRF